MAIIKCKMCGGDLNIQSGVSVAECEYCGTQQTVPTADNEKKLNLFARANRLRASCDFDKASGVYEAIVADFPEEAEAYWGLVLCKFGIEYVDDPGTGRKVPTCHRSSFDSITDDTNYEMTLENADLLARKVYREEAKAIEELRKGIVEVSSKEDPYDIFICYKETDADGNRTLDSVLAQDIYDALTEKGYRVFFARITLEDKLGQEYEPYIFAALHSAKVMLVVGTDYEHFNAVWVKNEWSRFLGLISAGEKKTLIPCYKGIDAYDMPKEFAKLQAQDLGKIGAIQDLLRGVEKIVSHATTSSEQQNANASYTLAVNSNVESALARAYDEIDCKDYKSAKNALDLALTYAPEDNRVLLAAVILFTDKREHFYNKYKKAVSEPDAFEIETISNSSNKEIYLYVFYMLKDMQRVRVCLNAGAHPNELHAELNTIVEKEGIFTCDPSYASHNGYSTVFLDAVYNQNYDLVELMLKSGASFYPEKICPIKLKRGWPDSCANPARCAVMGHIMKENDLRMLELLANYIPEIVNMEFSHRTDREAFSCKSDVEAETVLGIRRSYAGGIQTPLSYCVEYDIGDFGRTQSLGSPYFEPTENVYRANASHRYLDTAKWLIENGADINYFFHSLVFNHGEIREAGVSVLLCAVDRNNFEMVKLLVDTGEINLDDLNKSARWAVDGTIYNFLVSRGATAQRLSTTQQRSSGGCYVATAVYGSYDCPEVWTLRRFRDNYLQEHILGRLFIRFYYAVSPTIVRWFGSFRAFNKINRTILNKLVASLKLNGYSDKPYNDR